MSEYAVLEKANRLRRNVGASRTIAVLEVFFERGDTTGATDTMLEAGRARIAHPDDSLAQLADRLGVTKDTIAGRLRRLEDLVFARNRRAHNGI